MLKNLRVTLKYRIYLSKKLRKRVFNFKQETKFQIFKSSFKNRSGVFHFLNKTNQSNNLQKKSTNNYQLYVTIYKNDCFGFIMVQKSTNVLQIQRSKRNEKGELNTRYENKRNKKKCLPVTDVT